MNSNYLITDLSDRTRQIIDECKDLLLKPDEALNHKKSENSWSALECLEHLNRYANFYHPEISKRIQEGKHKHEEQFKPGRLGAYFAKSMIPDAKMKKMKTFKNMNPAGSELNRSTLETFIASQEELLRLLEQARKVSLTKTKTAISITTLLKLRLGDTFRVVVYHNERHLLQAKNALP